MNNRNLEKNHVDKSGIHEKQDVRDSSTWSQMWDAWDKQYKNQIPEERG